MDVEDYFHVSALAPSIHRDTWDLRESRVDSNTRRLLELLQEHRVRGTFFVLGWVAERQPQLVKDIAAGGHEVACHGFSHRLVYEQSPEEFRDEALRSKNMLEDLTGAAVVGYRAASYSIVRKSLWALDVRVELGFAYRDDFVTVAGLVVDPAVEVEVKDKGGDASGLSFGIERVGLVVDFEAVGESVVVAVGIQRIGSGDMFRTVVQSIAVAVRAVGSGGSPR